MSMPPLTSPFTGRRVDPEGSSDAGADWMAGARPSRGRAAHVSAPRARALVARGAPVGERTGDDHDAGARCDATWLRRADPELRARLPKHQGRTGVRTEQRRLVSARDN